MIKGVYKHSEEAKAKMRVPHKGSGIYTRTEKHNLQLIRARSFITDESRNKISIAKTGKKLSEETKKKMSENSARFWKGKKHSKESLIKAVQTRRNRGSYVLSEETKEKMKGRIPWNKGKTMSVDTINKIVNTRRKNNSYRMSDKLKLIISKVGKEKWDKIGRKTYKRYKHICNTTEYKNWRTSVFKRDNWKCKMFNENCKGQLQVHHIFRWADYPELRYDINNGITLCVAHHPRMRAEEKRLIPTFQELVSVSK